MGSSGRDDDTSGPNVPHVAHIAVAVAAAVTVLAGFSYATSSAVDRFSDYGEEIALPAASSPVAVMVSTDTDGSWRASRSPRVAPQRIVVDISDGRSGGLRVTAPVGRPLELVFTGIADSDSVTFETLGEAPRQTHSGQAVLYVEPLDPGAYPFATASGAQGGVLIAE